MALDSAPTPTRRILFVEDDLDQAHLVRFLLEEDGRYAVTHAQDGVRGTLLATDHRWDLVITDLNLPGVGGLAVLEASRRHHPETPVLAVTGYTGPEYAESAMERGAAHVLIKPLQRDELRAKVDELTSRRRGTESTLDPEGAPGPTPRASAAARVLAIGLRPGDAEAGCGAVLMRHRERMDRVIVLTLTHGSPGEKGLERREESKRAGRAMGVRFFVGNAGSGEPTLEADLRKLVTGAIREIRPDIIYVPTAHHPNPAYRTVLEVVLKEGRRASAVFSYDPGDASPEFRPGFFVPIGATLDEKLEVLKLFDPRDGAHVAPEPARVAASFWARYAGGEPAEALELVRGRAPQGMLDR
jgi:DNA-binding response OmpR family regulator